MHVVRGEFLLGDGLEKLFECGAVFGEHPEELDGPLRSYLAGSYRERGTLELTTGDTEEHREKSKSPPCLAKNLRDKGGAPSKYLTGRVFAERPERGLRRSLPG